MIVKPSNEEIARLAKAMNRLHQFCEVEYRSWDFKEATVDFVVSADRLAEIIERASFSAVNMVGKYIDGHLSNELSAEAYKSFRTAAATSFVPSNEGSRQDSAIAHRVDVFFVDPNTSEIASAFVKIGITLQEFLKSPEVKDLSDSYLASIRTTYKNLTRMEKANHLQRHEKEFIAAAISYLDRHHLELQRFYLALLASERWG